MLWKASPSNWYFSDQDGRRIDASMPTSFGPYGQEEFWVPRRSWKLELFSQRPSEYEAERRWKSCSGGAYSSRNTSLRWSPHHRSLGKPKKEQRITVGFPEPDLSFAWKFQMSGLRKCVMELPEFPKTVAPTLRAWLFPMPTNWQRRKLLRLLS